MATAVKHPVPDWVKPSFVIFDIWALCHSTLSIRVSSVKNFCVKNYKRRLNPVWHRMLYSCTHMATVGVKGLESWWGGSSVHAVSEWFITGSDRRQPSTASDGPAVRQGQLWNCR